MKRITISSLLAVLLLLTMGIGAALAAPVNSPHAETFAIECSDGEIYDVVVARGNPAHIVGSTGKLIPHHFTFEVIVDGESQFTESDGVGQGQKKGLQDRLITCTVNLEATPEDIQWLEEELGRDLTDSEVELQVTVEVMKTPAKR